MKVIQVTVHNHSSLGGPMGSDSITDIMNKIFSDRKKANTWIVKYAKKNACRWAVDGKTDAEILKKKGDMGNIGFTISNKTIL